ncbi:MAG: ATP-dependent 6-phosphofructokinase [Spirochaetota bacterium]
MEKFPDTSVQTLGVCRYDSPLSVPDFIAETEKVVADVEYEHIQQYIAETGTIPCFENAGPRKKIFFDPAHTKAAIVTCGGLCPGLNNVIQSVHNTLYHQYGVKDIYGVRYGYEGLNPEYGHELVNLTPDYVEDLHQKGGTVLGSSRGNQDSKVMVDFLVEKDINILFTVGGDGTLRGAWGIHQEAQRRGLSIAVVGVPKTIDNDISYMQKTFGFSTAVGVATGSIASAHAEAKGARNGIGLVKVMGRDSGFIAAHVALAANDVNYVFVPEIPFDLTGENGFLAHLHSRLQKKNHAVILIAEGAGQNYFNGSFGKDASGNVKFGDIGIFMKEQILSYFKSINYSMTVKYIDPSYLIRSVPASPEDAVYCLMLAQNAVHGAMAGKSGFVVGNWNSYFTFLPIPMATGQRKKIDPNGYLWSMVRTATGMPDFY